MPWFCLHYVLWLQSRSCFTANFLLPDSVERVIGIRGFISLNFFMPWSCLQCVLLLQSRCCFANFCFLTLSSVYPNQGLNLAKFFTPWCRLQCVWWLQSRSCFTANSCYLTLSSMYWIQGLNFAKFFTPWSCLLCFVAAEQQLFYGQYFVTLPCQACARTRGLISRPGLAYTVFCGSRLEAEFMAITFFVA